ncbi:MAG TPA: FAD-dependent monooxygenase, partial [Phycisphaerales bacterium]|nr:FAD-dependent monooxygenase [Phycisphaerales bacterium]
GGRQAEFSRAGGVAISRAVLDVLLVDRAVAAGAEFRARTAAAVAGVEGDGWRVRLRSGEAERSVTAGLVVAADGLNGGSLSELGAFSAQVSSRSWFGVGGVVVSRRAGPERGAVEMNVGRHGYVGLVRLSDGTLNVAAALDPAWTKRVGGPAAAIGAVLEEAGAPALDLRASRLTGTAHLTRRRASVAVPGVLVVGDAAGYVEPFTGEGMSWALAGAAGAAGMVNAGAHGEELAAAWSRWHASRVQSRQRVCTAVRLVLRRPVLVRALLGVIGAVPAAARAAEGVARRVERPYSADGVTA